MTRFTMKILGALVAVGCGSSAMAQPPTQGYWAGYYDNSHQTSPGPSQSANPSSPVPRSQGAQSTDAWDDQSQAVPESSQQQQPAQPSPQQPQNQNPWDQGQEEDSAETFSWSGGQSRLGVMVMGMTPELRMHFGAPSNTGVLIARVEPNSAATRAGLLVGDVLVHVGRLQIHTGDDVIQALAAQGGGRISLSVIRQGQRLRLTAIVPGQQPQQPLQQPQSSGSAI
jgi:membrane-associated protease RseP (regulator of RpoE activity)